MPINKIDSNVTGLRYAEEATIKNLPGAPVWFALDPNGYNDFGGQLSLVARNPINPSRQRKKGTITDLDASGGFGQDLTQNNTSRLFQGFMFSAVREKATNIPMNGAATAVSGVSSVNVEYSFAAGVVGSGFSANDLVLAAGFTNAGNNGLKVVVSSGPLLVEVAGSLIAEVPPATAKLTRVGKSFAVATVNVVVSGSLPRLTRASGTFDFTTLGLIPGEWIFIGGDSATFAFVNAANNGFARVRSVGADFIELDKTSSTMVAETGTGLSIRLFFGSIFRNEKQPNLIQRRSYQLERTLGNDENGPMSEYLEGAVPNEMSLQIRQADKITMDMAFVALDHTQRTGAQGLKGGDRPELLEAPAFNTSSDFSRIKMHLVSSGNANPAPLFAFLTELTLTVNNNVSPNKAIGVLGAFDTSAGTFTVSGSVKAYFAGVEAIQAVRNNSDVSLDLAIVKNNAGFVFDVPLIALGDGRLSVEQDQPITLPLTTEAAEGQYGYTLLINQFPYLPTAADL